MGLKCHPGGSATGQNGLIRHGHSIDLQTLAPGVMDKHIKNMSRLEWADLDHREIGT